MAEQPGQQAGMRQAIQQAVREAVQQAVLYAVEEAVRSLGHDEYGEQEFGPYTYEDWPIYNRQQQQQQQQQHAGGAAGSFDHAVTGEAVTDPGTGVPGRRNRKTCDSRACKGCSSADCKKRSLRWHKPGPHWCDGKSWGGKIWGVTRKPSDRDMRNWDMVFDPSLTKEETHAIRNHRRPPSQRYRQYADDGAGYYSGGQGPDGANVIYNPLPVDLAEYFRTPDNDGGGGGRGGEGPVLDSREGPREGGNSGAGEGEATFRGGTGAQPSGSSDIRQRRDDNGILRRGSWERISPAEAARRDRTHANVQMSGAATAAAASGSDTRPPGGPAAVTTAKLHTAAEDAGAYFDESHHRDWPAMRRSISGLLPGQSQRTHAADTADDFRDPKLRHDSHGHTNSCKGQHKRRHGSRHSFG